MRISKKKIKNVATTSNIAFIIAMIVVIVILIYFIKEKNEENEKDEYFAVGEFSKYYLQGNKYTEIVIEVDSVEGNKPSDEAINLLKTRIEENCDKDKEKINIDKSSFNTIPKTKSTYYIEDIVNLEKEYRNRYREEQTIVLYYIYLNGEYEESSVIGLAYSASSCAIFKEGIQNASTFFISTEEIEEAVVIHEFGHLLSLVNIGYKSDRDHEDSEYHRHCNHEAVEGSQIYDCVMYWAIETADVSATSIWNQIGGLPNDFCEHCKHDLEMIKQNQEKQGPSVHDYSQLNLLDAVDSSIFDVIFSIVLSYNYFAS